MPQITAEHEEAIAAKRSKHRQDKVNPWLINIKDLRLMPNVPNIRKKPDWVLYTGRHDATEDEKRIYLKSMGRIPGMRMVINSAADDPDVPFDLGKATKQEILDFALVEYGEDLSSAMDLKTLRKKVQELSEAHLAMVARTQANVKVPEPDTIS